MSKVSWGDYHKRYESIMQSYKPGVQRDKALSTLMDEIKRDFGVPLFQNTEWEKDNKTVIALYRIVSESRTLL